MSEGQLSDVNHELTLSFLVLAKLLYIQSWIGVGIFLPQRNKQIDVSQPDFVILNFVWRQPMIRQYFLYIKSPLQM